MASSLTRSPALIARRFSMTSPPQSPLLTSSPTSPIPNLGACSALRLGGSPLLTSASYRRINSSALMSANTNADQGATGSEAEYDGYAELLQFGHRMRWQPHAMVKPTNDCAHGHLTRGSEDTARLVPLREANEKPTIIE